MALVGESDLIRRDCDIEQTSYVPFQRLKVGESDLIRRDCDLGEKM